MEILKWIFIIGASLVVAGVVLVAIVVAFVKWKFGKWMNSLNEGMSGLAGAMSSMPGFRIQLKPMREFEWHHAEAGEAAVAALKDGGFVEAGRYTTEGSQDMRIVGLVHEGQSLLAAVYDQAAGGIKMDVVFDTVDEKHWTICNVPDNGLDHRESDIKVRHPEASAAELVEIAVAQRNLITAMPVKVGEFRERFEAAYAQEMDWRVARGGYRAEEIQRVAQSEGKAEGYEQIVEQIHVMFNANLRRGVEEVLRESLLATSTMTAGEWEEVSERLVFVFDMVEPEEVAAHLGMLKDFGSAEGVHQDEYDRRYGEWRELVAAEVRATSPRRAFAKLHAELDREGTMRKLATLSAPVEADVYVKPEEEDDEDDD